MRGLFVIASHVYGATSYLQLCVVGANPFSSTFLAAGSLIAVDAPSQTCVSFGDTNQLKCISCLEVTRVSYIVDMRLVR